MNLETEAICPSCGATVEPEQDGDTVFWPCACGYHFGHQRLQAQDDSCQIGVPIEVRISASQPAGVVTLESGEERSSLLFATIKKRPGL